MVGNNNQSKEEREGFNRLIKVIENGHANGLNEIINFGLKPVLGKAKSPINQIPVQRSVSTQDPNQAPAQQSTLAQSVNEQQKPRNGIQGQN